MKMKLIFLLFVGIYLVSGAVFHSPYDGLKVYRLYPVSEEQNRFLEKLQNEVGYDFWTEPNKVGKPVDIMITSEMTTDFVNMIEKNNIKMEVHIDDLNSLISQEKVGNFKKTNKMSWTEYYNLEDIYDWMESLARDNPEVEVISAGETYENREIKGVKIAFKSGKRNAIIEGGMHAREWISPATVTYLINEFLTSTDPNVRKIAESFTWYIFPSTNPDGYAYTHTSRRLWRKTRTNYGLCSGADANRNWDFEWGVHNTSTSPCSDFYGGPNVFSEKEMKNLSEYFKTIGPNTDVYLAFHSYSQYLMIPHATSVEHLGNYDDLYAIGTKAIEALASRYGTSYIQGTAAEILYAVSGSSGDWMKSQFKIPITYSYELRDTGDYGFLLPADQILPNSLEVLDSVIAIILEAEKFGYFDLE